MVKEKWGATRMFKWWYNCLQAKIGKEKEFETALQRLRGRNADISQEVADIRVNFATSSRIIFGFLCFSIC